MICFPIVATARVLCPVRGSPRGGCDGQGGDHPRHLPPGHHQEQARLQGVPAGGGGGVREVGGHVVHPLPGGHQLPLRVRVPPLRPEAPVRGDTQRQGGLHVGGQLPVEAAPTLQRLGPVQVRQFSCYNQNCLHNGHVIKFLLRRKCNCPFYDCRVYSTMSQ